MRRCCSCTIKANGRAEMSIARLAQWAGGQVSRAYVWAELQAWQLRNGENRTGFYLNGWTATTNLRKWRTLFLRKLRNSYEILTDERRGNTGICRLHNMIEFSTQRFSIFMLTKLHSTETWDIRLWDTLHTSFDGSGRTLCTVVGGGWGGGVAWQRPVGGTTVMTDAATSSVKT